MNNCLFFLYFVIVSVLLSSCCGIPLREGGYRPRHPNFKLAKHEISDAYRKLIDTEAIYISKSKNNHPEFHIDTFYTFYRFFKGGQIYAGNSLPHFPSNVDINNLREGLIGYCRVIDSAVSIELFVDVDCGQYETQYGVVSGDSIVLNQESSNVFFGLTRKNLKSPNIHYKVKEPWMKFWAQPDW